MVLEKKRKFSKISGFSICSIPKREYSEISETCFLLSILTVVATEDLRTTN